MIVIIIKLIQKVLRILWILTILKIINIEYLNKFLISEHQSHTDTDNCAILRYYHNYDIYLKKN